MEQAIEEEKIKEEKVKEEKVKEDEIKVIPHKDKPEFLEFCQIFCESEIIKVERLQRELKKAKKEYFKFQTRFKKCKNNDEAYTICRNDFEAIEEAYNGLDKQLAEVEKEIKIINEQALKANAMDAEVNKLKKEGKIKPEILHGSEGEQND